MANWWGIDSVEPWLPDVWLCLIDKLLDVWTMVSWWFTMSNWCLCLSMSPGRGYCAKLSVPGTLQCQCSGSPAASFNPGGRLAARDSLPQPVPRLWCRPLTQELGNAPRRVRSFYEAIAQKFHGKYILNAHCTPNQLVLVGSITYICQMFNYLDLEHTMIATGARLTSGLRRSHLAWASACWMKGPVLLVGGNCTWEHRSDLQTKRPTKDGNDHWFWVVGCCLMLVLA